MFVTTPVLGETREQALAEREAMRHPSDYEIEGALSHLSVHTEIDLSKLDLDGPLPELSTNAHQTTLKSLYSMGGTLRAIATTWLHHYVEDELIGTPDEVAEAMGAHMEEVGGDGFLISRSPTTRQYISQVCEGLAPALRRQGLVAQNYEHPYFRDNLMAF
jgi:alkanesulfonate monooxygenase SsuD/methylene tetrahydromethanopterin reductase-like flavin-dependent oxidoreductase (luciferase family)